MLLATWNLNNRVGKTRFRPDAIGAITALQADVIVLTEYYPQSHDSSFRSALCEAGWKYLLAAEETGEVANRVLIASRLRLEAFPLCLPDFDRQFAPNILSAIIPSADLRIVGLRIPAYTAKDKHCLLRAWEWLESTMAGLHDAPTVVLGDLNAHPNSPPARGGAHFRRILSSGWRRGLPDGPSSYFGANGHVSEVDHVLHNSNCSLSDVRLVKEAGGIHLAGSVNALSDHAALVASVS